MCVYIYIYTYVCMYICSQKYKQCIYMISDIGRNNNFYTTLRCFMYYNHNHQVNDGEYIYMYTIYIYIYIYTVASKRYKK